MYYLPVIRAEQKNKMVNLTEDGVSSIFLAAHNNVFGSVMF